MLLIFPPLFHESRPALAAATFALWVCGQGIHLMTLGGLALAVGILVDEATVAIENIHAHIQRGATVARAALDATRETAVPRLLAMLCVLAVFTPALFMTGAAKALFTPLALAVGFSMVASYFLSSTLVPVLCVWLLRGKTHVEHPSTAPSRLTAIFRPFVASRWLLIPGYLAAALACVWLVGSRLGTEIFPQTDSGQLAFRLRAEPGTKLDVTEQLCLRALDLVKREASADNVALTIGLAGVHASNYPVNLIHQWNSGPEEGWFAVQFRPGFRAAPLREKLRAAFAAELPGVRVSFEPSDIVSRVMSFGSPTPVEIAVDGADLATSRAFAEKILPKLKAIPALRDVQIAQSLDYPSITVDVNRERSGLLGPRITDVARSLIPATTSSRFTQPMYWNDPKTGVSLSVQVQVPQKEMKSLEDLKNIPIAAPGGKTSLLRNVATLTPGTVPGSYERYNMQRVVSITANIHDSDLGTVLREIERIPEVADAKTWPAKTRVNIRGQAPALTELLEGFSGGLLIAVVVVFLMLAANFQSFRLALAVISTVPAVLAGVVLALWITRTTLNIQSAIGAIMAVGVAVANAILLVTFAERARREGQSPRDAALAGVSSRARAILMTSFAMLAGMVPMALGFGEGGEQAAPLGRAVIGGLAAATVATLFILPAVFATLTTIKVKRHSLDPEDPESAHYAK